MCQVNSACTSLSLVDYMTDEIGVMIVGILFHIPLWFFVLMVLDIKKSGGRVRDAFKFFYVSRTILFLRLLHSNIYNNNVCLSCRRRTKK